MLPLSFFELEEGSVAGPGNTNEVFRISVWAKAIRPINALGELPS
jgi:hypothetical protein